VGKKPPLMQMPFIRGKLEKEPSQSGLINPLDPRNIKKGIGGGESRIVVIVLERAGDGKTVIRVKLYSTSPGRRVSYRDIEFEGRSESEFVRDVNITGGALAEWQNATGDNHDPSLCARAAVEGMREALMQYAAIRARRG